MSTNSGVVEKSDGILPVEPDYSRRMGRGRANRWWACASLAAANDNVF
jgi:hypothetical protein